MGKSRQLSNTSTLGVSTTLVSTYDANTTSTGFFQVPVGTTAQRPANPTSGTVRYNSNSSSLEIYTNTWQDVGTGAAGGGGAGAIGGVFYENSNTISSTFTSTPGKQIYSAGTLTLSDPLVTVTIANGSIWTVI